MRTDVSKADDVDALAEAAYERFGAVHLLCNNAGVFQAGVVVEAHASRLGVGAGRQLLGRAARRAGVRTADDRCAASRDTS